MFARATGAEVHLLGLTESSLEFAAGLGFEHTWTEVTVPDLPFDAVIDASNAAHLPELALGLVEPGGTVVYIGLASVPSRIDTRALVLGDVTAVGVLSASPGLEATISAYAEGSVDPRPLIAATVGLAGAGPVLAGERPPEAGPGPKMHIDPGLPEAEASVRLIRASGLWGTAVPRVRRHWTNDGVDCGQRTWDIHRCRLIFNGVMKSHETTLSLIRSGLALAAGLLLAATIASPPPPSTPNRRRAPSRPRTSARTAARYSVPTVRPSGRPPIRARTTDS
ncbi:hypothetical protein GCM10029992_47420 [Glycomyces albus]